MLREKDSVSRAERWSQHKAAASSMGYNIFGAEAMQYPGVLPKVAGAVSVLKGMKDFSEAYGYGIPVAKAPQKRIRDSFNSIVDSWSSNEGSSLRDRLKRGIASEALPFRDQEYRMRFNRSLGGMMTSMAGVAIMDIGPKTTSSNMLAAGLVSVGLVEQLHNRAEASNRDRHLQTPSHQPESVMPVVHRLDSSDL